jgi:hypothetical protein
LSRSGKAQSISGLGLEQFGDCDGPGQPHS